MEGIHIYYFHILRILELPRRLYFIPVSYELDRYLAFTNQTNVIFVHGRFGSYARFFPLISIVCIYSGNLPLEVLYMLFTSDIVSVDLLESCVLLIFPARDNIVAHLRLLFK